MKEVTLKRNSWHRWLALQSNRFSKCEDDTDICRYTKCVLLGALFVAMTGVILAIMVFVVCVITAAVLSGLYYVIFSPFSIKELFAMHGWVGFSMMFLCIGTFSLIIGGLLALLGKVSTWLNDQTVRNTEPTGFIGVALKSLKDKTCFKVRFTDK